MYSLSWLNPATARSLTVLGDVNHGVFSPAEEEVADSQASHQGDAEPHVVRHEHQHEDVGGGGLDHVQTCLDDVTRRQHWISESRFFY